MGKKDIIGKDILRQITVDFANLLLGLDIDPDHLELLETEEQRIENRRSDFVARVRQRASGEPFLLHIELQNDNHPQMPLRMLRYYTDIQLQWPNELVRQFLVYVGKRPLAMADHITHPDWRYCYTLFDIREVDCQTLLDQGTPDALVMAILCDFKDRPAQQVVNHIVLKLKELTGEDEKGFRRYFDMLEVLSTNRDLNDQLKEAEAMLKEIDRTQLPSYELGLEDGIEKGIEKGRFEGTLAVARKLLSKLSDEEIVEITGLKLDLIRQLRHEHKPS